MTRTADASAVLPAFSPLVILMTANHDAAAFPFIDTNVCPAALAMILRPMSVPVLGIHAYADL
jgi:hypothetical protein